MLWLNLDNSGYLTTFRGHLNCLGYNLCESNSHFESTFFQAVTPKIYVYPHVHREKSETLVINAMADKPRDYPAIEWFAILLQQDDLPVFGMHQASIAFECLNSNDVLYQIELSNEKSSKFKIYGVAGDIVCFVQSFMHRNNFKNVNTLRTADGLTACDIICCS